MTSASRPSGFETPLIVELDGKLWALEHPLFWRGSDGDILFVQQGEETDFASTPRLLQALLPSADSRVVRAAVVHDFLCRTLNDYYRTVEPGVLYIGPKLRVPKFSAVDADAIFRKIMKDEGAGWIMQQVGWVGVRWGAAKNPARRGDWWSTFPELAWKTALLALPLVALVALAVIL